MINIIDFIQFGKMLGIDFSITSRELIDFLGDTEHKGKARRNDKNYTYYKYDKVEFHFDSLETNSLKGILIQPNLDPSPKAKINFDYGWIKRYMEFKDVASLLKESEIPYHVSFQNTIMTSSEVSFWFYDDNDELQENLELCNIGRFI